MHVVCVLFLISWIAYYQRRLQRLFPVVWKDSVEHTGNNALGSYFFFFLFFFFIIIKKSKIKKEKEKKTFFKLLARWSPARPVPWAVCLPVHHCYPVSGRMLLTGETPLPQEATTSCAAAGRPLSTAHSRLLDIVGLGQQRWSSSHEQLQ